VVRVSGPFSRAGGFQHILDNVVPSSAEERQRSLAFLVDTDMTTYPGFLNSIVKHTRQGKVQLGSTPREGGRSVAQGFEVGYGRTSPVASSSQWPHPCFPHRV
jgi:hypothetical protein